MTTATTRLITTTIACGGAGTHHPGRMRDPRRATAGRVAPPAPLAQWQSNGLLIRRFRVRIPGGALMAEQTRPSTAATAAAVVGAALLIVSAFLVWGSLDI